MILSAAARTIVGKKVKTLRSINQIPAIVYGHGIDSKAVSVAEAELLNVVKAGGTASILDLSIDGTPVKALIKEVCRHPVSGKVLHVDFQAVKHGEKIRASVPVAVKGEAAAVKELGAVLVRSLNQVELECLPEDLPPEIIVDVSTLAAIGDMIRVGDIRLAPAVRVITKPETVVVVIERKEEEEVVAADAAAPAPDLSQVKTEGELRREEKAAKAEAEKTIETK